MVGTVEIMKLKISVYTTTVWEIAAEQPCHREKEESSGVLVTHIPDFVRCKTDSLLTYLCSEAGSYYDSSSESLSQVPGFIGVCHCSKVLFY